MEDKAVRGISWTFLGLGVSKSVALLTTIALAALVSPSDFGLMAIGLIVVNFVSWFGASSFGGALIVHQNLDEPGQGTVLSLSVLGAAAAALLTLACAPVLARTLHQPRLAGVVAVLAISVLISGLSAFYEAQLQNHLEFRRRFLALTTQTATFSAVSLVLAALGAGVWSLVAGQVVSVTLFTAALIALAPRRIRPTWDRAQARVLFASGCGFALQGLTSFIRQNIDVVAVARTFSSASVGFYTMAFRVGDLTYSALADPIARVTFPAFARGLARDDDIRPGFLTALRIVSLVTVPCGVILSAASGPFTHTFFGPAWEPMVAVLGIVGVWAAIHPAQATLGWLLNSLGRAGAVGRVAVFVLAPIVLALVLVVGYDDLALVALVPLADTLVSLGILTVLVGRHAGLPAAALARAVAPVALAGSVAWVVTRFCADGLAGVPALLALVGAAGAGGAAFLMVVLIADRPLIRSAATQTARVLGRRLAARPAP